MALLEVANDGNYNMSSLGSTFCVPQSETLNLTVRDMTCIAQIRPLVSSKFQRGGK